MSIVNLSTMIENNGLPVFINNLNKPHTIPLMSSVSIQPDSEENNSFIDSTQFFIVAHTRDCDGTPLYHLANTNFNTAISLVRILRYETHQSNIEIAKLFNQHQLLNDDFSKFISVEALLLFHDLTKNIIHRNYPENSISLNPSL